MRRRVRLFGCLSVCRACVHVCLFDVVLFNKFNMCLSGRLSVCHFDLPFDVCLRLVVSPSGRPPDWSVCMFVLQIGCVIAWLFVCWFVCLCLRFFY